MKILLRAFFLFPFLVMSQDDLLSEIQPDSIPVYAEAAFKGLKIVNFESTKLVAEKQLTFIVSHRFGSIENGFETFFGLDDAVTNIQFVYGITDAINISVARSSYQKIYELFLKYRILRQTENGFPFTVVGFNSITVNSGLKEENLPKLELTHRLGYTTQLLISRKFNSKLSLEVAPTFFHNNYVILNNQKNSQFAIGMGGRYKIGKRWSINADYGLHLNRAHNSPFHNPISIGVDLETGGHVFQMHFTNAQPILTNMFLSQATGEWNEGNIYFGFNLSRFF